MSSTGDWASSRPSPEQLQFYLSGYSTKKISYHYNREIYELTGKWYTTIEAPVDFSLLLCFSENEDEDFDLDNFSS
jgi:hypothetical protein